MTVTPTASPKPHVYPPPPPPIPPVNKDDVVAGIPVAMGAKMNNPQPPPTPQQQLESAQLPQYSSWSTGLCDCFSDMHSCCLVFWCPCIAFGRIAEIVDKGTSSCCGCGSLYMALLSVGLASAIATAGTSSSVGAVSLQWILSCVYRGKLKQSLNMRPSSCEDCCTHYWCEACALCQEYRELQNRGYDLSLGWEGNLMKQNAASTNPREVSAPVAPSMKR